MNPLTVVSMVFIVLAAFNFALATWGSPEKRNSNYAAAIYCMLLAIYFKP